MLTHGNKTWMEWHNWHKTAFSWQITDVRTPKSTGTPTWFSLTANWQWRRSLILLTLPHHSKELLSLNIGVCAPRVGRNLLLVMMVTQFFKAQALFLLQSCASTLIYLAELHHIYQWPCYRPAINVEIECVCVCMSMRVYVCGTYTVDVNKLPDAENPDNQAKRGTRGSFQQQTFCAPTSNSYMMKYLLCLKKHWDLYF